jgi:hypothetical protein
MSFVIDERRGCGADGSHAKGAATANTLTDKDTTAPTPVLIRAGLETLPAAIAVAGARSREQFIGPFTANIRNRDTRKRAATLQVEDTRARLARSERRQKETSGSQSIEVNGDGE